MSNLYLIKRADDISKASWGQYVKAVVVAESEEDARNIHPDETTNSDSNWEFSGWIKPKYVEVTFLGVADSSLKCGSVICADNVGS